MWYNVDWSKLTLLLLPTFLRKNKLVTFIQCAIVPMALLHDDWKLKRETVDWYKLNHTGQVFSLRQVLNDRLDVAERRIYIGDGNAFPRKYIYTRGENKPVFLGKLFIYQNSEYVGTGADFTVYVPQTIIDTKIHELNALITFYKLASKRYKIQAI